MLRSPAGATIDAIMKATGWQQHSVRGFLAGVVRKRLNLKLSSEKVDGNRIYQIRSSDGGKPSARAVTAAAGLIPMPRVTIGPALPDRETLSIEIARLRDLDIGELRSRWHTVFGRPPPRHLPRHLLFRMVTYRLQADRYGDLDGENRRLLDHSETPEEAVRRALGSTRRSTEGMLFTVQKALPLMPDGAAIILPSSVVGSKGLGANSVYAATKAVARSFARTWTTDLKQRRIRVNAISPGSIDTPGLNGLLASSPAGEQRRKMIATVTPLGRLGTADEIAAAAVFLASDDASYVTGTELFVDGGFAQV